MTGIPELKRSFAVMVDGRGFGAETYLVFPWKMDESDRQSYHN
jgi:hypothetical protein